MAITPGVGTTTARGSIAIGNPPLFHQSPRAPVNWRSVLLGLSGVIFISALAPYNDNVVNNSQLIGNCLPAGLLMFFMAFIILVNAPLWRWAPRQAMDSRELGVATAMMLCGCALPEVGLMRYLPGHLVAFFYDARTSAEYHRLLSQLALPDWMFPTFASKDITERGNDIIVQGFFHRIPIASHAFLARFRAIPWSAWFTPAVTWGILVGAVLGGILFLSLIFRHQWAENERLPFPLVSIYVSLIESPEPGRSFNRLFRSRGFWIAFGAVFVIHAFGAMHQYDPLVPTIPMGYNLHGIMASPPWSYTEGAFQAQTIYFTIVGIMFFVQSRIAFSLWFFFVAVQVARMMLGAQGSELTVGAEIDQTFGAMIPFAIGILWVGRRHLAMVGRRMLGGAGGERETRYLPYGIVGWGFLLTQATIVVWLVAAGASIVGAVVLTLMLVLVFLVVGRIVAETGLLYVLLPVPLNRPWVMAASDLPASMTTRTTVKSFFLTTMFYGMFTHDLRESAAVFVPHALRVTDVATYPDEKRWQRTLPLIFALVLSLAVAYVVSGAAQLYIHYSFNHTLDTEPISPIGAWGSYYMPKYLDLDTTLQYIPPGTGPDVAGSGIGHFAFGAALTTLLGVLRLRFADWPLHPVGFIMVYSWGLRLMWFSIFLGWLLKVLVVRLGGSRLLRQSRHWFLGMIIGDAAAIAFWLVFCLVRLAMGLDYHAVQFLPT